MVSELSSKNRRKKKCPRPSQSASLPSAITFTILCPPWNHIALPPPPESLSAFQVESEQEIVPADHSSSSQTSSSISPSSEVPILSAIYHRHRSHREKKENWNQKQARCKKVCLSCGTKKTPRWHKSRFMASSPHQLFCNACAIRIKKYHLVCSHCHYALNRDQATKGTCPHCKHLFVNLIHEADIQKNVSSPLHSHPRCTVINSIPFCRERLSTLVS